AIDMRALLAIAPIDAATTTVKITAIRIVGMLCAYSQRLPRVLPFVIGQSKHACAQNRHPRRELEAATGPCVAYGSEAAGGRSRNRWPTRPEVGRTFTNGSA